MEVVASPLSPGALRPAVGERGGSWWSPLPRSSPHLHGDTAAVRRGEGRQQCHPDLHGIREPQAHRHLAERGRPFGCQWQVPGRWVLGELLGVPLAGMVSMGPQRQRLHSAWSQTCFVSTSSRDAHFHSSPSQQPLPLISGQSPHRIMNWFGLGGPSLGVSGRLIPICSLGTFCHSTRLQRYGEGAAARVQSVPE